MKRIFTLIAFLTLSSALIGQSKQPENQELIKELYSKYQDMLETEAVVLKIRQYEKSYNKKIIASKNWSKVEQGIQVIENQIQQSKNPMDKANLAKKLEYLNFRFIRLDHFLTEQKL